MARRTLWLTAATALSLLMAIGTATIHIPGSMAWCLRQTDGLGTLDTQPLAGATMVHEVLHRLGPQGRDAYLNELVVFDIAFPIALLMMVHLALVQLWSPAYARRLVLLPWFAMAIDIAENICAAILTTTYPSESATLAVVIGWLTATKFGAYAAGMAAVIIGTVHKVGATPKSRIVSSNGERAQSANTR